MLSANLQIEVTDGVVILGARGSGKSTLLKYLVTTISAVYKVVVFDVIGNLEELKKLDNVAYYRINLANTEKIDNLLIDIMEHGNMMVALDEADRYKYTKMLSNFTNLSRNFNCLLPNTIILGDNKPIQDYKPFDRVASASGLSTVYKVYERDYDGEIITIKASGLLPIQLTDEHPLLVAHGETKHVNRRPQLILSKPTWKKAKDVVAKLWNTDGDYLIMPIINGIDETTELNLTEFIKNKKYHALTNAQIIDYLKQHKFATLAQLSSVFGISKVALDKRLKKLQKENRVSATLNSMSKAGRGRRDTLFSLVNETIYPEDNLAHNKPLTFPLNEDTAWLLGIYVAEGCDSRWNGNGRLIFTINKNEVELKNKIISIINKLGYSHQIVEEEYSAIHIYLNSILLTRAFASWCGHLAHNKKIPDFILYHKNINILKAFLDGYMAGDGCITKDKRDSRELIAVSTTSKVLAMQLQLAYLRFGKFINISVSKAKDNVMIAGTLSHEREQYHLGMPASRKRNYVKIIGNYAYIPIRSIQTMPYKGKVYNLGTTDETFLVSNIITHNCGFLAVARRTANLNKDFLANARWAFVFRHILPQDLEVLVEWLDATEEEFRTLKDYEFMIFKDGNPVFKGTLPKGGKAFVSTGKATPASQSQMQSQSPSSQSSISQERKGKNKKLAQNI